MEIQLNVNDWLKLPIDTRLKLRELFDIPKSEGVILEDGIVKSDGTTYEDLQAITVEKMRLHLDSEDPDFVSLFHEVVARIEDETQLELPEDPETDHSEAFINNWVQTLNQMKSDALEQGLEFHLKAVITRLFPTNQINNQNEQGKKQRGRPKKTN